MSGSPAVRVRIAKKPPTSPSASASEEATTSDEEGSPPVDSSPGGPEVPAAGPAATGPGTSPGTARRSSGPWGGTTWIQNSSALDRSRLLFFLGFLIVPAGLLGTFLVLTWVSPYPGVRDDFALPALLGVLFLAIVAVGWLQTLGRTPRAFRSRREDRLEVLPYQGPPQILAVEPGAHQLVLEIYPGGLVQREPVELLDVVLPSVGRRRWLVDEHLLDDVVPRRAPIARKMFRDDELRSAPQRP